MVIVNLDFGEPTVMNCPACTHELTTQNVNGIYLYICADGCGGIWFDWPELSNFDEAQDPGPIPLDIHKNEEQIINYSRRFGCPHCSDIVMARHFIKVIEDVLVDECPSCGGFWLNGDEVDELRQQSEDEQNLSASAASTAPGIDASDPQAQRMRRLVNAILFLCPGQYVPS